MGPKASREAAVIAATLAALATSVSMARAVPPFLVISVRCSDGLFDQGIGNDDAGTFGCITGGDAAADAAGGAGDDGNPVVERSGGGGHSAVHPAIVTDDLSGEEAQKHRLRDRGRAGSTRRRSSRDQAASAVRCSAEAVLARRKW